MSNIPNIIKERIAKLVFCGVWSENVHQSICNLPCTSEAYHTVEESDIPGALYWRDIDYTDGAPSWWQNVRHYTQMLMILRDFGRDKLKDEKFAAVMRGLFEFWLEKKFTNKNWWHNDIGTPRSIGDLAIALEPVLDRSQLDRAAEIAGWGSFKIHPEFSAKWTGANLVWGVTTSLRHAVLTDDAKLLGEIVRRCEEEIRFADEASKYEGINPDGRFFQHGRRLYSGGYGRSFAYEMSQLMYILSGTEYQLSEEKRDFFLIHILDGLRYMTRGDSLDCSCVGREINRVGALRPGILKTAVGLMLETEDMPRKDEIRAYYNEMCGVRRLNATKYFEFPKLLCHQTDGLYVGLKNLDNNSWDMEYGNGEGILFYNMSYGSHCTIMREGGEYVDLMPVMDYSYIPGTTARYETDDEIIAHGQKWVYQPLMSDISGGRQYGKNRAVIWERAVHDGITVDTACFAYEGGAVFVGRNGHVDGGKVHTTLDHCRLGGEVSLEGDSVVHNGIRYTRVYGPKLTVKYGEAVGSWNRINDAIADTPVNDALFTVTMEHENSDFEYCYIISPENGGVNDITINGFEVTLSDGTVMRADME